MLARATTQVPNPETLSGRTLADLMADVYVRNAEAGRATTEDDLDREGFSRLEIAHHHHAAFAQAKKRLADRENADCLAEPDEDLIVERGANMIIGLVEDGEGPVHAALRPYFSNGIIARLRGRMINRAVAIMHDARTRQVQ